MYANYIFDDLESELNKTLIYLKNHGKFAYHMEEVVNCWPNTMINHLTNKHLNKIAFIGQCAAFYGIQSTPRVTKLAWKRLTANEMNKNNESAEKILRLWEYHYMQKLKTTLTHGSKDAIKMDFQMRLQLD